VQSVRVSYCGVEGCSQQPSLPAARWLRVKLTVEETFCGRAAEMVHWPRFFVKHWKRELYVASIAGIDSMLNTGSR
jgi:hypothetical protein